MRLLPKASPPVKHSLDERIAAVTALAPSERQVARFFAERRDRVAFMSAAEIAQELELSTATVVRAAQALGYAGLPDLKEELGAALRASLTPAARIQKRLDELGPDAEDMLDHLIALEIGKLEDARRSIQGRDFRHAVEFVRRAARVVVVGLGPNRGVADHLALGLRRFGHRAVALGGRGTGLADDLMEVGGDDVVVLLAYERVTREVTTVLDVASERHVPCVLITDTLGLALADRYAVALSASRGTSGSFPTLIVPLLLVEALLLGLAAQERPRVLAALERVGSLRSGLEPS